MTETPEERYNQIGWSVVLHIVIAAVMLTSWGFLKQKETIKPPAMMKAALVHAPKSTMPQQKTQTEKPQPKKDETKPEPPKPEIKPKEVKPEIKPKDKPSPVAVKPAEEKPKPKDDSKKPPDKKPEPPKPDAKQAAKKQQALSQKQKEKISKDAEMALEALLNEEDITREGELDDNEIGRWVGIISARVEENWNRPPNARRGMVVTLEIELLQTGEVVSVRVIETSGNRAFDLAAETAVRKVGKFEEISQMKPELFNRVFRKFNLLFNPEDLLM